MSKKTAPRIQFNFLEDEEPIETIEDLDDEIEQPSISLPRPIEREPIKQESIFDVPEQNQLLKELVEKELPKKPKETKIKEPKLTKSGKPRKPLTEEQKERLAIGRQKALEVRRAKMIQRQEDQALEKEEKELLSKKKKKDLEKLKQEIEEPQTPKPAPVPVQPHGVMFTQKQLEESNLNAIMSYEKIRRERKRIKAEEELIKKQ